jgi:hypothetical protein
VGKFNESYYAVSVREWEDEKIPFTLRVSIFTWVSIVAIPAYSVGTALKIEGWTQWGALIQVSFLIVGLFVIMTEVNENVRYVRHQLSVHRGAFKATAEEFRKYKHPEGVTLFEALDTLERNWW